MHIAKSLDDACRRLADEPAAVLLAGGTDFMVEVNYNRRKPDFVIALDRVPELKGWRRASGRIEMGAAMTYAEMEDPLFAAYVPSIAQAARTVGSPQIRNAGTLGGNLATASPAGDTLPPLVALDARVTLQSVRGEREISLNELIVGVKTTTLAPDEIIQKVSIAEINGPQEFLKVGVRNAMVISIAAVALVVDKAAKQVRTALGSVSPVPLRTKKSEEWISENLDWASPSAPEGAILSEFGKLVAEEAAPITDQRSTADYRRYAVGVMAQRALARAFS